jgi:hypothetical protein
VGGGGGGDLIFEKLNCFKKCGESRGKSPRLSKALKPEKR